MSCLHSTVAPEFVPGELSAGASYGDLTSNVGQAVDVRDEATCDIATAELAFRASSPVVLRGCVAGVPPWTRERLRQVAPHVYEDLEGPEHKFSSVLPPELYADLRRGGHSMLGQLFDFSDHLPTAWLSPGDQMAAMHYDTFDNLHALLAGHKTFYLVSPAHAREMYLDFADDTDNKGASPGSVCQGSGGSGHGCDGLGCFGYLPFDARRVDLAAYPRVRDVTVHRARLGAGDVLVLPAFWLHYIVHEPQAAGAPPNTALTFTRQRDFGESLAPLAESLVSYAAARSTSDGRDAAPPPRDEL